MRTFRTVVARLQAKMAEAMRSPTRFKALEEEEIVNEAIHWLKEVKGLPAIEAEDVGTTLRTVMQVAPMQASWTVASVDDTVPDLKDLPQGELSSEEENCSR
jgi:hypothetical protein